MVFYKLDQENSEHPNYKFQKYEFDFENDDKKVEKVEDDILEIDDDELDDDRDPFAVHFVPTEGNNKIPAYLEIKDRNSLLYKIKSANEDGEQDVKQVLAILTNDTGTCYVGFKKDFTVNKTYEKIQQDDISGYHFLTLNKTCCQDNKVPENQILIVCKIKDGE